MLVLALVSAVTVAALTAAFLELSGAVTRRQAQMRDRMHAFYLAEAGLAEAWAAVQIRKSGEVGSEADPAIYGNGLLWVEATELGSRLIRLESNGVCGTGEATLALVVEEGEYSTAALGVHSNGDLSVPPGTVLDGYDSRVGYGRSRDDTLESMSQEELDLRLQDYLDQLGATGLLGGLLGGSALFPQEGGGEEPPPEEPVEETGPEFSARLGSGGNISIEGTERAPVTLSGNVVPGPGGTLTTTGVVEIAGETEPASTPVELPAIDVPSLPALAAVSHSGLDPLFVLPLDATLPALTIAEGAEVVVSGPSRLVVGELSLGAGSTLYFDTTEGPVTLYVTESAAFAADARVMNSSESPSDLSLRISAEPAEPIGLPAGAPMHAIVYAPGAHLVIPQGFELFGALSAARMSFGGAARLHFDEALIDYARNLAKPRLLSWRIVELANEGGGLSANPFVRMGLDPATLRRPSEAHADQPISIRYKNTGGADATFTGMESAFDWSQVSEVEALDRGGKVVVEDTALRDGTTGAAAAMEEARARIRDLAASAAGNSATIRDQVLALGQLSDPVLVALIEENVLTSADLGAVLQANDCTDKVLLKAMSEGNISSGDLLQVLLTHVVGLSTAVVTAATSYLSLADLATLLLAL